MRTHVGCNDETRSFNGKPKASADKNTIAFGSPLNDLFRMRTFVGLMILTFLLSVVPTGIASAQQSADDVREYLRVVVFDAETVRSRAMVRLGDYLLAVEDAGAKPASDPAVRKLLDRRDLQPVVYERLRTGWKKWVIDYPTIFGPWQKLMQTPAEQFPATAKQIGANADGTLNDGIAAALTSDEPADRFELARLYNVAVHAIERQWGERFRGELARQLAPTKAELSATPAALRAAAVERVQAAYRAAPDMNPKFDESTTELVKWLTEPGSPFAFTIKDYEEGGLFPASKPDGFRATAEAKLLRLRTQP
ncbi:MAG: hypothetical protein ACYTGL_21320 [Planctomycetota bacterium]|jgi:hypothetical protein